MTGRPNVLLCWERDETNSWNPILAELLRQRDFAVEEASGLGPSGSFKPEEFDVCLPRVRVGAAHMACLDELLSRSTIPVLNSRDVRRRCENKALAHLAFARHDIPQPGSFVVSADGILDRPLPEWAGATLVKPLYGSRGGGIEICPSLSSGLRRARQRREDLLVQQMIWPARCWRVVVGRHAGVVDPYWRKPPDADARILSVSTGSRIMRSGFSEPIADLARRMLNAVDGDILAVDILETDDDAYALEINHNFDAHGGDAPAADAFVTEILQVTERRWEATHRRSPRSTPFANHSST
jgi:glutathione synthase/RimK-type ligase-like ATP-grasp enzyme